MRKCVYELTYIKIPYKGEYLFIKYTKKEKSQKFGENILGVIMEFHRVLFFFIFSIFTIYRATIRELMLHRI